MPQVGGAGSDDLASSDEIKVFEDEGEKEEENRAISEQNLNDLKSSLITEGEQVCVCLSNTFAVRESVVSLLLFCSQIIFNSFLFIFGSDLSQR